MLYNDNVEMCMYIDWVYSAIDKVKSYYWVYILLCNGQTTTAIALLKYFMRQLATGIYILSLCVF